MEVFRTPPASEFQKCIRLRNLRATREATPTFSYVPRTSQRMALTDFHEWTSMSVVIQDAVHSARVN